MAGCPSGQWERTVNPSRKLRRFESFTCHQHGKEPLTRRNPGQGLLLVVRQLTADSGPLRLIAPNALPKDHGASPCSSGSPGGIFSRWLPLAFSVLAGEVASKIRRLASVS